jgi:hypothetical protein
MRNPSIHERAVITPSITARPPWTCNSTIFSPVKLAGDGNQKARAASSKLFDFGSNNKIRVAILGAGDLVHSSLKTNSASLPDIRITARPAFPVPLASAKIVPDFIIKSRLHILTYHIEFSLSVCP